ncbi:MCE family protein [Mycolicibacterium sp. CH28]|uniref:MCE family protein n=1 Tax=Mycolicibacterium sp. CH28 TaxID=2512237 RepID=UPI0010816260|nr:MCE family protein [Mycolicibacterium sp. CH28]TGD87893.1 MCE family protein [Mycolicibacterium sp. CH28]
MTRRRAARTALALVLVSVMALSLFVALRSSGAIGKTRLTAFFESSTGLYPGDQVRILGVPVGEIETIEPQPQRAKITFWIDDKYAVPATARAVVLSPSLVTARAIQLTPAYTGGARLPNNAVIPLERTSVPVEWDDLRTQLQRLTQTLQPAEPGGVSTLGAFVNTVADNVRGQGASIRDTVKKLSQSLSILGDHSGDIFGAVRNLAILVSALHDSTDLMRSLNANFAAVTALLSNDPDEVGRAVSDLRAAVGDVQSFVAANREAVGITSDKVSEVAGALGESIDDIKQALHLMPTTLSNYVNIYQPAQGAVTGVLAGTNFSNPINFICGAIQAASRLGAEQSAKLCVQYLAPIIKNRQYNNLLPLGFNMGVGAQARPNEVTYSEDWLRPDFVPPAAPAPPAQTPSNPAAESPPTDTNPADRKPTDSSTGLAGLMVAPGGGS